ncbi:MAG: thiamine pyrophosphate-binding protein [Candidatus Acidiferrales bacterium]
MPHRIADELVRRLAEAGVERIYGVVGDSLNPVTDALRLNTKVKWVHVRNEEAGAFAAGAEAQLTGKLAACGGSCGPGNLHLINGLFDAHRSNAPLRADLEPAAVRACSSFRDAERNWTRRSWRGRAAR